MRICAVADLHGNLPVIPPCDLLLIAGDVCPDFVARAPQRAWFVDEFLPWQKRQPAAMTVMTWGNHDWMPRPAAAWADLHCARGLVFIDELAFVPARFKSTVIDGGIVKIWCSPWSNQFNDWAWMQWPENLKLAYDQIPEGTDIILSHQPPYGYGDVADPRYQKHLGSVELMDTIERVEPRLVICGHIHGGFGHYEHEINRGRTDIYNVSLVNEAYTPVNPVTVIEYEP